MQKNLRVTKLATEFLPQPFILCLECPSHSSKLKKLCYAVRKNVPFFQVSLNI